MKSNDLEQTFDSEPLQPFIGRSFIAKVFRIFQDIEPERFQVLTKKSR